MNRWKLHTWNHITSNYIHLTTPVIEMCWLLTKSVTSKPEKLFKSYKWTLPLFFIFFNLESITLTPFTCSLIMFSHLSYTAASHTSSANLINVIWCELCFLVWWLLYFAFSFDNIREQRHHTFPSHSPLFGYLLFIFNSYRAICYSSYDSIYHSPHIYLFISSNTFIINFMTKNFGS